MALTWKISWQSYLGRYNGSSANWVAFAEWVFQLTKLISHSTQSSLLQQIKPNIFPEIHAIIINAAGIGSGLLQGIEHIIL